MSEPEGEQSLALFLDLETRLHRRQTRNSREAVAALLDDEFVEFGSSGTIFDKAATLATLAGEQLDLNITVSDFKVRHLSPTIVLATYAASKVDPVNGAAFPSLRSSIWRLSEGGWKMVFHQGSKV